MSHAAMKSKRCAEFPAALDANGITDYVAVEYYHYMIKTASGFIDYWPGNDHGQVRNGCKVRDFPHLVQLVKQMNSSPAPKSGKSDEYRLTKREQFAMAAMQGFQASNFDDEIGGSRSVDATTIAEWSVEQADLLIAELEKSS